ncbi:MAG: prolyl oligopeptidase family serine peptidase, partial [Terracidiphilus sp.]
MRSLSASLVFLAASLACGQTALQQAPLTAPPPTPVRPEFDYYFNAKIQDNYRWLEDGSSPEVTQWVAAQNTYTAAYMDRLPERNVILNELRQRIQKEHTNYAGFQVVRGRLFALRFDPGQPAPRLVVFSSPENIESEHVILDAANFLPGKTFQVDWYRISPDGRLAGLALSTGGSEDCSLYVVDTDTGRQVGEVVPRVSFATGGGDMAWNADSSGFYYTRYPQGSERPAEDMNFYQQVYFHRLGRQPSQDLYILGKDFPRIAETTFAPSPDHTHLIISVANGDGGQFEHFLLTPDGKIHPVTQFTDKIIYAVFGQDNSIWLLSRRNSNMGEILHIPGSEDRLDHAQLIVHASDASIEGHGTDPGRLFVAADRLYLTVIRGGPEEIRVYSLSGQHLSDVKTPPVASIGELVPDGDRAFLFAATTYTTPQQWYRATGSGDPASLPFHVISDTSMDDIAVERVFATSKDGTHIPMTILMRKGTRLDGSSPALITGYGGFGISTTPFFAARWHPWFDHGAILAIANIRGGAEYGEDWHQAGMLTRKQNVFDDFAACAQYLVTHNYTRS